MCIEQWASRDLLDILVRKCVWELYCVRRIDGRVQRAPRYSYRAPFAEVDVKNYLNKVFAIAIAELQMFATGEKPARPVTSNEREARIAKLLTISKVVTKYSQEMCKTLFNDKVHQCSGIIQHLIYEVVVKYNVLSYSYNKDC